MATKRYHRWLLGLVVCLFGCQSNIPEINAPRIDIQSAVGYKELVKHDEPCTFTLTDSAQQVVVIDQARIRLRGNSTAEFPKRPFNIRLSQAEPFLDLPAAKSWVLLANYFDKTMLRNALAFYLSEQCHMGWTPHFRFVDLYYNGEYKGVYQACEKVEVHPNRVNVGENGWLIEIDARVSEKDHFIQTTRMEHPFRIDWPHKNITDEQILQLQAFFQEAEDVLFSDHFTHPTEGWRKYLDEQSWINWYLINEIAKNGDGNFYSSCYMHSGENGKIVLGPLWDYDTCFGNNIYDDPRNPEGFYVGKAHWFARLMEDPLFAQHTREQFAFFYARQEQQYAFIRHSAQQLLPFIERNDQVWHTIGASVSPYLTPNNSYDEDINALISWLQTRYEWLNDQMPK